MFNIGAGELIVILVAALVLLGPKRLPEVARGLGKFLREFRRQTDEVRSVVEREFYRMDQDFNQATSSPSGPAPQYDELGHLLPAAGNAVAPQPAIGNAPGPLDASTASTQMSEPTIMPPSAGLPIPFETSQAQASPPTEPALATPLTADAPLPPKPS